MAFRRVIRALLLDAHGTLLELEPPAPALRRLLAERHGVAITAEGAAAGIAAEIAYYRRHLGEGRDAASVDALRQRCASVLRAELPAMRELEPDVITEAQFTSLLLSSLTFRPFPEVPAALATLRERGIRLVVASNWDASLAQTLDGLGLLELVDGVVTSAQCGVAKPGRRLFEEALRAAGAHAQEAVHVGDSVAEDVAGARSAGIEPVLIVRDGARPSAESPPGVRVIRSLTEVCGLRA